MVVPAALGAPPAVMPWVAFAIAAVTAWGTSTVRPTVPAATRLLRTTAALVCAVTGGAGLAGSLATPGATLAALLLALVVAGVSGLAARDPAVRLVAWPIASAAALAVPVTGFAAAGRALPPSAFGILAVAAALLALAWLLARADRPAEAAAVELTACVGAGLALLLTLGSSRYAAAVLTIWGVLLGVAALRLDRPPNQRIWLVRAGIAAQLGAAWLLLYSAEVALPEAYTLPFATVALAAGVLELRTHPELSSWVAYGPALAAGFLPSLALALVQGGVPWQREALLFAAAIVAVVVGSWRRRSAPVVTGGAVAVVVALTLSYCCGCAAPSRGTTSSSCSGWAASSW
jgi:hypothetical protein